MNNVTLSEVINTKSIEYKVYQMMETAMIVSEMFANLDSRDMLNENYVYGECDSDTYSTLIDIALEIEKQNTDENPICIEDIKEMAEKMILKAYPKKKKYAVTREYFKQVVVEADSIEEAKTMASSQYLFDNVTLEPGDTTAEQVE